MKEITLQTLRTFLLAISFLTASLTAASAERLRVITTFTVIADMAANVAGEVADVDSITKPGAQIHGYSPTPRDILRAQKADLILWNGLNLERWFEQFFSNLRDVPEATLSAGIEPIGISQGAYSGKPNPHAWMSLSGAYIYVDNIRDALSKHDPANADTYATNAAAYKEQLRAAVEPIRDQIRALPENRRWLATCEGAFSYLNRDYHLQELYLWPINADQTGTPQQVRKVIDAIRENGVPAMFCESTVNINPAKQVAHETGARFGGVLYVDSLTKPGGAAPTYLDLLRVTSQTILDGLRAEQN